MPRQTHFNFVGLAPYAAILSVLLVIGVGGLALPARRQPVNFGVDFVGGTKMEVTTPRTGAAGADPQRAGRMGADDAEVQGVGRRTARRSSSAASPARPADAAPAFVQAKLQAAIPGLKVTGVSEVGREGLRRAALTAASRRSASRWG